METFQAHLVSQAAVRARSRTGGQLRRGRGSGGWGGRGDAEISGVNMDRAAA